MSSSKIIKEFIRKRKVSNSTEEKETKDVIIASHELLNSILDPISQSSSENESIENQNFKIREKTNVGSYIKNDFGEYLWQIYIITTVKVFFFVKIWFLFLFLFVIIINLFLNLICILKFFLVVDIVFEYTLNSIFRIYFNFF